MRASFASMSSPATSRKFSLVLASESAAHELPPGAISAPVVVAALV